MRALQKFYSNQFPIQSVRISICLVYFEKCNSIFCIKNGSKWRYYRFLYRNAFWGDKKELTFNLAHIHYTVHIPFYHFCVYGRKWKEIFFAAIFFLKIILTLNWRLKRYMHISAGFQHSKFSFQTVCVGVIFSLILFCQFCCIN